jgi:hypothetical protein
MVSIPFSLLIFFSFHPCCSSEKCLKERKWFNYAELHCILLRDTDGTSKYICLFHIGIISCKWGMSRENKIKLRLALRQACLSGRLRVTEKQKLANDKKNHVVRIQHSVFRRNTFFIPDSESCILNSY